MRRDYLGLCTPIGQEEGTVGPYVDASLNSLGELCKQNLGVLGHAGHFFFLFVSGAEN